MLLAAALLGGSVSSLLASRVASADGNPATDDVPRVVAYSGNIELDGLPFSGDLDFRFRLYDGGDVTASWEEVHAAHEVFSGVFSVELGRTSPIDAVVAAGDALSLGIDIRIPGEGAWTQLGGRQAFATVPYAMWAASGADFTIARDSFVGRDLDVVGETTLRGDTTLLGALSAASASLAGDLTAASGVFSGGVSVGGLSSSSSVVATSIEVRPIATPFIDFANDSGSDFDARFILTTDDRLVLEGAALRINSGGINGSGRICSSHIDCFWSGPFGYNVDQVCGDTYVQTGIRISGTGGNNYIRCCELQLRPC